LPPAASAPLALLLLVSAPAARAGEVACWFDNGAVVVPAMVGGVAGDYILDTGTAHTILAETQAQGAGYADTALKVEVRIAGLTLTRRPVAVLDIDPRSHAFPTPIAGVIGADILADHVLEVSFAPCRVGLYRPGRAPRLRAEAALPIALAGGVPTLAAAVADGPHARAGRFVIATGGDTAVRIDDGQAQVPGSRRPGWGGASGRPDGPCRPARRRPRGDRDPGALRLAAEVRLPPPAPRPGARTVGPIDIQSGRQVSGGLSPLAGSGLGAGTLSEAKRDAEGVS
jgi:hypothetical protein